ncbi:type VI secretion protein (plasmid) [Rhizobium oryzihabitans]|jgi:type IV secretion system protein VirB8|uniref:Type IV secretion system protein virB8 n=1 Tax=Rhizobium oryzihabitans TaxID=2267833 RepID=A0A7L5BS50_9HYPH|nr:type IV secretion system protein [Rhizobium oryzihabitans]QIB41664.1 type VI secretion protein [Rhizobium oryzihabitans]
MSQSTDSTLASYFKDGAVWEADVIRKERRSKRLAWAITILCIIICLVSLAALASLVPLKSYEPYLVVVDKNTGYIEVKSGLDASFDKLTVTERQAVTQANVVRFMRMREGYDPSILQENFRIAALLSTGDAARDLQELYSATNPKNPTKVLGKSKRVRVEIKSVTFLNDSTASVRFSTEEKSDTETTVRHFVGVVRFRYTSKPQVNEWMFENPLGFQVYSYRRDQETVGNGSNG